MSQYPSVPLPYGGGHGLQDCIGLQQPGQQLPYQLQQAGSMGHLLEEESYLSGQHASFRMGAGQHMHRNSSKAGTPTAPPPPAGIAAIADAAAIKEKCRRRWMGGGSDDAAVAADVPGDFIPAVRPDCGNSGHIVRMRRGEAWARFLAYEGCCQVCMKEGSRGVAAAAYFLSSGCEPLRSGLGITGLLLPQVLSSHMASAIGNGSTVVDLGNEIHWDDSDADSRKLNAAAFLDHMNVMKVRVARLDLPQSGMNVLSRLVCRTIDYSRITVHFKLVSGELLHSAVDVPFRLRKDGAVLLGSPVVDLQPEHHNQEVMLEIVQGTDVLARGKVSCKRLWQIGMEHSTPVDMGCEEDESDSELTMAARGSICHLLAGQGDTQLLKGSTALWVNVYDSGPRPGKVLLMVQRAQREMVGGTDLLGGEDAISNRGALKVSSCQAYDFVLKAALEAQGCNEKRLEVSGEWAWLLQAFASHYGVRNNYTVITHLHWVLRPGIASASRTCFDLLSQQLRPLLEQQMSHNSLTKQEATMLSKVKADAEELLKLAFENYYLLSSVARKGILDGACSPPPGPSEFPATALVAAVHLFEVMRDVFHPSDVEWLSDRFRIAAKGRWSRLANLLWDGGMQQDGCSPLMTGSAPLRQHQPSACGPATPAGKANQLYAKMLQLAAAMKQDLEYDRRLQEVPRLLPSSLNIAAITAAEYCASYAHQLRCVLSQYPPNQPTEMVIDLLVGVAQLQRYLDENRLAVPRGQPGSIDALELFGPHVRSWITHSQEALCATCRALEASTELSSLQMAATQAAPPLGGSEEGGVAPICAEMLRNVMNEMQRFDRVVTYWPQFGPYLEAAVCVVLRAILAAVSRQCGMTRVRAGVEAATAAAAAGLGSPTKHRACPSPAHWHTSADVRSGSRVAQWTWTQDSPSKGPTSSAQRVLLMVREAVLLNSLKRLMVAVPQHESTINKWTGGCAQPPAGAQQQPGDAMVALGYEDIAPVGAQFAQVVKELRTEYSSAVSNTCQRLSTALAANHSTSIWAVLNQAKLSSNPAMTPMQQTVMIESLSSGMLSCLHELLGNLAGALDGRVFVATGRGLWDFVGRELLDFVQNLQEGKDNKGAWRTRQNASLLLELINNFFRSHLVQTIPHNLQEQDLAMPLHIDATQKLLAGNTTALNQSFTPF